MRITRRNRAILLAATATLGIASTTWSIAQAPAPPEQIRKYDFIEGSWEGTATITAGGESMNVPMTMVFTKISNGFGMQCLLEANDMPGVGCYREVDLLGYEPARDCCTCSV